MYVVLLQYGQGFTMFNTSFSWEIIEAWDTFKRLLSNAARKETKIHKDDADKGKKAAMSMKYDMLLGFTESLYHNDTWMHDHEVTSNEKQY